MKWIILICALVWAVITYGAIERYQPPKEPAPQTVGTCRGKWPCTACWNCSQCKYCHVQGGHCGVCLPLKADPLSQVDWSKDLDAATIRTLRDRQRSHAGS